MTSNCCSHLAISSLVIADCGHFVSYIAVVAWGIRYCFLLIHFYWHVQVVSSNQHLKQSADSLLLITQHSSAYKIQSFILISFDVPGHCVCLESVAGWVVVGCDRSLTSTIDCGLSVYSPTKPVFEHFAHVDHNPPSIFYFILQIPLVWPHFPYFYGFSPSTVNFLF